MFLFYFENKIVIMDKTAVYYSKNYCVSCKLIIL